MTFLTQIDMLVWEDGVGDRDQQVAEILRKDYDAFCAFVESGASQPVLNSTKTGLLQSRHRRLITNLQRGSPRI